MSVNASQESPTVLDKYSSAGNDDEPSSQYQTALSAEPLRLTPFVHEAVLLNVDRMNFIDAVLVQRLTMFANYVDSEHHTFPIDHLPTTAAWGRNISIKNNAWILCAPGTNEPCILRLIGRVSDLGFYNNDMKPKRSVYIDVIPATMRTSFHIRCLLGKLSRPAVDFRGGTVIGSVQEDVLPTEEMRIRAATHLGDILDELPGPFNASYDARTAECGVKLDTKFPVQDLRLMDTVLLEVSIGRYRINWTALRCRRKPFDWVQWRAYLELHTVVLIHRN